MAIKKGDINRRMKNELIAKQKFLDSENIFEKIKEKTNIVDIVERYGGVKLDRNYHCRCPFPAHNDKNPSFSVNVKDNYFQCFGCGKAGDSIAFVSEMLGFEPIESAKRIAHDFNISIYSKQSTTEHSTNDKVVRQKDLESKSIDVTVKVPDAESVARLQGYVKRCLEDVELTNFFTKRGLSKETIKRFCLGYDKEKDVVIMPYNKQLTYYCSRCVQGKEFKKPSTEQAGAEPIFNANALNATSPIFVVESIICAMSIAQCGGVAVALGGVQSSRLIDCLVQKECELPLIIALDNDKAGKEATKKLCEQLSKLDFPYMCCNIADGEKDPNALLMKSPKALADNVAFAIETASKRLNRIGYKKSVNMQDVMNMSLPEVDWLVEDMFPVGLMLLAAPSKIGKSWLMLQLCNSLSQGATFLGKKTNKCEVLYLALEDNLNRLKFRMKKLLGGKEISKGFNVRLTIPTIKAGLFDELEKELAKNNKIRLIVIDTLQFIRDTAGKNEGVYANDCRELKAIKNFADSHGVGVILVHHLSKRSDTDNFNRISGSTGIMGTCDNSYIMTKSTRLDDTTDFELIGRDVMMRVEKLQQKDSGEWEIIPDAESLIKAKEMENYGKNDIVRVIKHLLQQHPYGWSDTMNKFMQEGSYYLGYALPYTSSQLGKEVKALDKMLAVDGILHTSPTAGGRNGRKHSFTYMSNVAKQGSVFDCE